MFGEAHLTKRSLKWTPAVPLSFSRVALFHFLAFGLKISAVVFVGGESCTSTIDGYTNRSLAVSGDAILDVVCWNSCDACASGIAGCTNPEFLEYDPYATEDDGSCATVIVPGCIYEAASNYNPLANVDDNSCEFDGATNDCPADLDQDGAITTADLLAFLAMFGTQC